jgi:hypothetical protein
VSNFDFTGPHVAAAFLCEKVLIETGSVPSFIRVVDRFQLPKFTGPIPHGVQIPQQVVQFSLVVMLKSGDLGAGSHTVTIRLQKPDGTYVSPDNQVTVFFQGGDDNGAMIVVPLGIPAPQEGLHWFDIQFEGGLVSRIPMRILYQNAVLQLQQPPTPEGN